MQPSTNTNYIQAWQIGKFVSKTADEISISSREDELKVYLDNQKKSVIDYSKKKQLI